MRRWLVTALIFCGGLLIGSLAGWQMGRTYTLQMAEGLDVGQFPPKISALDLTGTRQTLKQYRGKVLVLHFWASWCPHCRNEIPKLLTLYHEGTSKEVAVLTVSTDQHLDQLQQFVAQESLPYAVIADQAQTSSITARFNVPGIPVTYVIGRDGRIAARLDGESNIVGTVQQVLEQSSRET